MTRECATHQVNTLVTKSSALRIVVSAARLVSLRLLVKREACVLMLKKGVALDSRRVRLVAARIQKAAFVVNWKE